MSKVLLFGVPLFWARASASAYDMLASRGTSRWRAERLRKAKPAVAACRPYSLLRCKGRMLAKNLAFSRATASRCTINSGALFTATSERSALPLSISFQLCGSTALYTTVAYR